MRTPFVQPHPPQARFALPSTRLSCAPFAPMPSVRAASERVVDELPRGNPGFLRLGRRGCQHRLSGKKESPAANGSPNEKSSGHLEVRVAEGSSRPRCRPFHAQFFFFFFQIYSRVVSIGKCCVCVGDQFWCEPYRLVFAVGTGCFLWHPIPPLLLAFLSSLRRCSQWCSGCF